jgi:integrase
MDSGVVPDDRLTVRAFLDRWLTVNLPGSVAESTEDDYVDTVRLHLVPALGRKPLARLTVADRDRLWKAKRDAGYGSKGVRIMRTVLRRALGQAVREGIVARNVAGLSASPRIRAKDGRTLTVDQARQLLEAAAGYRLLAATLSAHGSAAFDVHFPAGLDGDAVEVVA